MEFPKVKMVDLRRSQLMDFATVPIEARSQYCLAIHEVVASVSVPALSASSMMGVCLMAKRVRQARPGSPQLLEEHGSQ